MSDDSQQTPSPAERDTTTPVGGTDRPELEHHSGAVERARADLAAGRAWKARDRLTGHLADNLDPEALELLGEVHYAMGDMPAAGAAWFGTGRRGQDVDEAVEAWRERHNDHFDQMWRSLPRTVRDNPGNPRVEALRRRAGADRTPTRPAPSAPSQDGGGGVDAAVVITVVLAILFVVCAIVGAVTVLRWMLPG